MKRVLLSFFVILCSFVFMSTEASAKKIKIVTTPENDKIYVDGNYVGDGVYVLNFTRRDEFFSIKVEASGYIEKTLRVYKYDTRKSIPIDLQEDESLAASVQSDLANGYYTINVREGVDEDLAWKLLTQVMLNYFNEMKTSDKASGYMNTTWQEEKFPKCNLKVRTSVQIKEITNEGLAYQIRIRSEISPMDVYGEQSYIPWPRVLKRYEPLINEMQQRLGKN